ncbi:unnamed protein product [Caenorhabditis brenneri]
MDKSIVPANQLSFRSSTCYEFSNPNGAVVVEIEDDPVEVVEKKLEDLKLNYQFNEKEVPQIFQDLMKNKKNGLKVIGFSFFDQYGTLSLDEIVIKLENKGNDWLISYNKIKKSIKTVDPEKSIIDHLWFVLRNPDIKISSFRLQAFINPEFALFYQNQHVPNIDFEKLNTLLLSMLDSIDHQFHIYSFDFEAFNINVFLSMLKHLKPGTLGEIDFGNVKNEEVNCQKMKEIIEMDQWKQARKICSSQVIPSLKIEDLLHCEVSMFAFEKITPEDVVRVRELFINSTNSQSCTLFYKNEHFDFNAFRKVLLPNSLSEKNDDVLFLDCIVYTYKLPNSPNCFSVALDGYSINFYKNIN